MLILVSCGASSLSCEKKKERTTELQLGTVKGLDMFVIRAKQKQQQARPEVWEFMDILQQHLVSSLCPQIEKNERKEKKLCYCQTDVVCGVHATSHLSSTSSRERGNSFWSVERRWRTDPGLSTSTCNAQLYG